MQHISENLERIEREIAAACARAGRRRDEVQLIAVSKTFAAEAIDAAVTAGVTHIGENRVQEFRDKRPLLRTKPKMHLIGHLQSNKAKDAVRLFDVIQTVDSADLAAKIGRHALGEGRSVSVMVQVNIGREPQKSGVAPAEAMRLCEDIAAVDGVELGGLMTIPPIASEAETRSYFRTMKALRDEIQQTLGRRLELSMGMSDDFVLAIEEGSTMVRLGRALFGKRETR